MIVNLITSEKSSRSCQSASSGVTRILLRPLLEILSGSFFEDILSGVCFSAAQPFGLFGASQRKDDLYYWLAYFQAVSIFSHIFGYGACTSVPNWWRPLVRFSTLRFLVSFSKGFARNKKNRKGFSIYSESFEKFEEKNTFSREIIFERKNLPDFSENSFY